MSNKSNKSSGSYFLTSYKSYNGDTKRSLGYFNAVANRRGGRVRIQLMQLFTLTQSEATEVSGRKLDDGVSRNEADAKGTLSIIEVEIYETISNK